MNVINLVKRPEFVFRPSQVVRRLLRKAQPLTEEVVPLPWGCRVRVRPRENVGDSIYYYGIFDKVVPEAIFRLVDKRDTCLDVGANLGQNASAMSHRTGAGGRVIAFEPHPEIYRELQENFKMWPRAIQQNIELADVALGETTGTARIVEGSEFSHNRGCASLDNGAAAEGRTFEVKVRKLDECGFQKVGVCKIDVEGHELSVLKGASDLLGRSAVRDIIFEDFSEQPSLVIKYLQERGFHVYELRERWLKPCLAELGSNAPGRFTHNFLATLDPRRATERFRPPGWKCLIA
jgi:FkbM family methyltransferase